MYIAAIAYLYVMCMVSAVYMANDHFFIGLIMLTGGILPVALWLWLVSRRRRSRLARIQENAERELVSSGSTHSDIGHTQAKPPETSR